MIILIMTTTIITTIIIILGAMAGRGLDAGGGGLG